MKHSNIILVSLSSPLAGLTVKLKAELLKVS